MTEKLLAYVGLRTEVISKIEKYTPMWGRLSIETYQDQRGLAWKSSREMLQGE